MARQVFLSGHGGWKPENGYVKVPKGCTIHFYTHFAKNMMTTMERKILSGDYTTIDRTINQFMQCPDMILSHQNQAWTDKSKKILSDRNDGIQWVLISPPTGRFKLSQIFDYWAANLPNEKAEFHWLACQTLKLTKVGGRKYGLNAADFSHDLTKPGKYRITTHGQNGKIISWL